MELVDEGQFTPKLHEQLPWAKTTDVTGESGTAKDSANMGAPGSNKDSVNIENSGTDSAKMDVSGSNLCTNLLLKKSGQDAAPSLGTVLCKNEL